jgi:hypothetical protein
MNEPMEVAFAPDRLAVLLKHFAELNDERESWRVAYPLKEVLLLVTCATIDTCDDFDEIVLATAPETWPWSATSPSVRQATDKRSIKRRRKRPLGTQNICFKSWARFAVNLDSAPWT